MKKYIAIGLLVIVAISLIFINKSMDGTKKKKEEKHEEVSTDLFGKYYPKLIKEVEKMSLEEKVGQLFLVRYDDELAEKYITKNFAGGFVMFSKDFNGETKESIKERTDELQKLSKNTLTFAVDEEGGNVTRISRYKNFRSLRFASPRAYYDDGGYERLENSEKEKAELLLSLGINLNLAPVVDVSTNEDDYIYDRAFGRDAKETAEFAVNMVKYAKDNGISSCLKHFPGYGNNVDTHTGIAIDERDYKTIKTNDYLPFKNAILEGAPCILVSHNIVKSIDENYPSSLSKKVVTGELREKLDFSGIIITDDLDMDAVTEYAEDGKAATLAINAGVDLIITGSFESMYNEVLQAVKDNKIDEEKIDTAVLRVLAWKKEYSEVKE